MKNVCVYVEREDNLKESITYVIDTLTSRSMVRILCSVVLGFYVLVLISCSSKMIFFLYVIIVVIGRVLRSALLVCRSAGADPWVC